MAKSRYINTKFWDDEYIIDLDPIQKLLFLYCLTNPLTNISGIYEIALKRIAFDTGIDKDMLVKIFKKFEEDGKILYNGGWIAVKNWIKHQDGGDKIKAGIDNELSKAPSILVKWVMEEKEAYPIDTLSIPHTYPSNYRDRDINLNRDINTSMSSSDEPDGVVENNECEKTENPKKREIPYFVVQYLNDKIGGSYRETTKITQRLIKARYNEGFKANDFIKVIDKKVAEWRGTEFERFLRPETLFGPKFESYLNQTVIHNRGKPQQQSSWMDNVRGIDEEG